MQCGRISTIIGGLVLTTMVAACSPASGGQADNQPPPDRVQSLAGWHSIGLPDGMVPATLTSDHDVLFIGGSRTTGGTTSPALAALSLDQSTAEPAPIRLTPRTPYGKVAELTSIDAHDGTISAVGVARGGAHSNPRWTVWTGTRHEVVDRPQTFETFGGWDAGALLGVAVDARGPLVAGTWQGPHGLDGAAWRAKGERWVRQSSSPVLQNTADRQVSPRFLESQGDGSVIMNGSVIDLTNGVHQSAVTWRDVNGSWTLTPLPDPGRRSEAWSTACTQTCWSAGFRDDKIAVWSAAGPATIPDLPAGDTDAAKLLVSADRVIIAVSEGKTGRRLIGHDGSWHVYSAPDGAVQSATMFGSRLYLVAGKGDSRTLWARDLSDVLA